jgi:hypothetical protein
MKIFRRGMLGLGLGCLLLCALAQANAPPVPKPVERPQAEPPVAAPPAIVKSLSLPVTIQKADLTKEGVQAKIILSQKTLAELSAPGKKASPQQNSAAPASPDRQSSTSLWRNVIAGVALSLAAVSLIFVFRGRRSTRAAVVALLGVTLIAGGVGVLSADIRIPGEPYRGPAKRPDPEPRPEPHPQVQVIVMDDAVGITLVLPE